MSYTIYAPDHLFLIYDSRVPYSNPLLTDFNQHHLGQVGQDQQQIFPGGSLGASLLEWDLGYEYLNRLEIANPTHFLIWDWKAIQTSVPGSGFRFSTGGALPTYSGGWVHSNEIQGDNVSTGYTQWNYSDNLHIEQTSITTWYRYMVLRWSASTQLQHITRFWLSQPISLPKHPDECSATPIGLSPVGSYGSKSTPFAGVDLTEVTYEYSAKWYNLDIATAKKLRRLTTGKIREIVIGNGNTGPTLPFLGGYRAADLSLERVSLRKSFRDKSGFDFAIKGILHL